jgi:hypothetical protein
LLTFLFLLLASILAIAFLAVEIILFFFPINQNNNNIFNAPTNTTTIPTTMQAVGPANVAAAKKKATTAGTAGTKGKGAFDSFAQWMLSIRHNPIPKNPKVTNHPPTNPPPNDSASCNTSCT